MEKQTKTILTIVGVVAAVVIGYKILSPKEEEEKSGFWGWNPKKKRVTLDAPAPVNTTLGHHCDCKYGMVYNTTTAGSSWLKPVRQCNCKNTAQ